MKNNPSILLPTLFDPEKLKSDLAKILPEAWISHYRGEHYEGNWSVAPLRSVGGHPAVIYATPAGPTPGFYKDTPILQRCEYFQEVIQWFQCQVNGVRLMSLDAGARILEHTDDMDASEVPELRIHVPVLTNPDVDFWVAGQLVPMREGEVWYADFKLPHSVNNRGSEPRIHLVLDCSVNDWLLRQLEKGEQIALISQFLKGIGLEPKPQQWEAETFLPGIKIENGGLFYDPDKLVYPGDLLHEAGHLAVMTAEERALLSGNVGEGDENAMGNEIAAILWSYAAIKHIGLPPSVVFHEEGYKGQSDWFISNFEKEKNYIGLPLLAWMGLANAESSAFPSMLRWLRQ
ncbi:MAG: aspartyl/asparaginyl beta-hydroxylase domain-containing protein [Saprospiraceae bacterium]|nr:aspartyl/asparaginyl beta-hydroxylase domain-containing protein [Saprospiraceae bacterium]